MSTNVAVVAGDDVQIAVVVEIEEDGRATARAATR
jgi:hypothetical protein